MGKESYGQPNSRLSFQLTPLYSYLDFEHERASKQDDEHNLEDPKLGYGISCKFEKDINKFLSFNTGMSYEIRKNDFTFYITLDSTALQYSSVIPIQSSSKRTYSYIGIPLGLGVNYINNSKIRVYQTFNFQLSYLLNANSKGTEYFLTGEVENFDRNNSSDRRGLIYSLSSSIILSVKLSDKISIKVEPGLNYMLNDAMEYYTSGGRFLDLKCDFGIICEL